MSAAVAVADACTAKPSDGAPARSLMAGDDGAIVRTHGLTKHYAPNVGVLGVDLDVMRGSVFGLVGRNGAGKTTLLSLLCGLVHADGGRLEVRGRIALCPDTPAFEPWLTGREVLQLSLALARPGHVLPQALQQQVLAETGVADFAERRCGGYSRGMMQRLGIAAALVLQPDLLVLDEPTSALDPPGRADVLRLVHDLRDRCTVLLSSHALADVQRVADSVAVLEAGRVLFAGRPQELVDRFVRPTWRIRLGADADELAPVLAAYPWMRHVRRRDARELEVETHSLDLGELHLVPALARAGVRVLEVAPMDADLDAAFAALTRGARANGDRKRSS